MAYKPIRDYGIIGNTHTAALVAKDGSIDWLCFPRFDSPSVFAAILDDEKGGRCQIAPVGPFRSQQRYWPHSNVLETVFDTEGGQLTLTDFMPCYRTPSGRLVVSPEIHRVVRCQSGQVTLRLLFHPRCDYARAPTVLTLHQHGAAARGGGQALALAAPVALRQEGDRVVGEMTLRAGQEAAIVLSYGQDVPGPLPFYRSRAKLAKTDAHWRRLVASCPCDWPGGDMMIRSYLVLHLLVYSPTGAIVAAPTTSLPEEIGGVRNWDYRYAWLRDFALTLEAFFALGHVVEGHGFMRWLTRLCASCGAEIDILYGVGFEAHPAEYELPHLEGYRGSSPVRVGNGAFHQLQLDVFGEVLDAAHSYLRLGQKISRRVWRLLAGFVEAACANWRRPDQGIWEVRAGPYHFVHSKVMCWVAVDRGIKIAEALGQRAHLHRWRQVREEIRQDILAHGWSQERGAFVQHYGSQALDASALLMPLVGFLPANDPRVQATIARIREELSVDGLVYRYQTQDTDDGLPGSEGSFNLCSFWLVRALALSGRLEEAQALFQRLLGLASPLGLFAEMVDVRTGEALGNYPQAFTHIALIRAAQELATARRRGSGGNP